MTDILLPNLNECGVPNSRKWSVAGRCAAKG